MQTGRALPDVKRPTGSKLVNRPHEKPPASHSIRRGDRHRHNAQGERTRAPFRLDPRLDPNSNRQVETSCT
jgi:hypothetical protein